MPGVHEKPLPLARKNIKKEVLRFFSAERAAAILARLVFAAVLATIVCSVLRNELPGPLRLLLRAHRAAAGNFTSSSRGAAHFATSSYAQETGTAARDAPALDGRSGGSARGQGSDTGSGDARAPMHGVRRAPQLSGGLVSAAVSPRGGLRRKVAGPVATQAAVQAPASLVSATPAAAHKPVDQASEVVATATAARESEASPPPPSTRNFCEDHDLAECDRLVKPTLIDGSERLPDGCHPPGILGVDANSNVAAARATASAVSVAELCPRSCGLCALLLSDCAELVLTGDNSSCVVGDDVVGQVCAFDGDVTQEGYCTWMPASPREARFVCARCADRFASPERRAVLAQVTELREEEDGRPVSELVAVSVPSMREWAALIVPR